MNSNRLDKTPIPRVDEIDRPWVLIDAEGQTLGRLASKIATLLLGKHKRNYTPHLVTGDRVIVINAEKIRVTGKKLRQKIYYRHTGWWGGLKEENLKDLLERAPDRVIHKAVSRMVNRSSRKGRQLMTDLRVFRGPDHTHKAQNPVQLKLG